MKVSYNWLKEFVDINISVEELADKLTMAGLEVAGIIYLGQEVENVIVGEILSIDTHPNADKLTVCRVSDGKNNLQIVCGAKNIKVGDKVPLALVGAKLSGNIGIKKTVIRGVESQGMLCSEKELGFNDDVDGILILDSESVCGEDVKKILGQDDIILDIDLTTNRGDCLSILGIAREIAAILNVSLCLLSEHPVNSFKFSESTQDNQRAEDINKLIKVQIKEPHLCSRYSTRIIKNVRIVPSPLYLQYRLKSLGIRPINNVVDITNLVLLELGHPLHAFDYDLLEGKEIIVRVSNKGEKIITLDEIERNLDEEILVIADSRQPVALAGIMGGLASGVTSKTRNVLLESAYFNPTNIRRSARKLDLATEATYRFERGVDIENLITALEKAADLIQKYCGGEITKDIVDVYPSPISAKEIILRPERVNKILGIDIPYQQMKNILKRLGFNIQQESFCNGLTGYRERINNCQEGNDWIISVPLYRNDVVEEIDLIEEIARIYGYDKIKSSKPCWQPVDYVYNKMSVIENLVKDVLNKSGFFEVINFSFMDKNVFDKLHFSSSDLRRRCLNIENPLSAEMGSLRSTLIPGILENVSWNLRHNINDIKIFEIGSVFMPRDRESLPIEKKMLIGAVCGKHNELYWKREDNSIDFYYLSGIIEALMNEVGISDYYYSRGEHKQSQEDWQDVSLSTLACEPGVYMLKRCPDKIYHSGRSAEIIIRNDIIGTFGELSPLVCTDFDFRLPVYLVEIDFNNLIRYVQFEKKYKPMSKYPAIIRDIALIISDEIDAAEVFLLIRKTGENLLKDIRLFDLYKGEQIKKGAKSLAYSLVYQSYDATLTDEEVNKVHKKIIDELQKKLQAEIRD